MNINIEGKSAIYEWYKDFSPLKEWHDEYVFKNHWDKWYAALREGLADKTYEKNTYVTFFDSNTRLYIEETWVTS